MASLSVPQEIILMLCKELAARRDFDTLFQCSLVSTRVASIALEQLYSIHDLWWTNNSAKGKLDWSRMWKSIILSSIGGTAYPYCIYVNVLSIGGLEACLIYIDRHKNIRDFFFDGPMGRFLLMQKGHQPTETPLPLLNSTAIANKCADAITVYIKRQAGNIPSAQALEHLEGMHFYRHRLPTLAARLSTLVSLHVVDGTTLSIEAASAIFQFCPKFIDLTCTFYQSSTADEDLAAFFQMLRHNSLQRFQLLGQNMIGGKALTSLNAHATSLRILCLFSLSPEAMKAINSLPTCTALEWLQIENDPHNQVNLADTESGKSMLKEVRAWICNCKSLQLLQLSHVLNALPIVREVLRAPDIRLKSLIVNDFLWEKEEDNTATWDALALQDGLAALTLGSRQGTSMGQIIERGSPLAQSICKLKNLRLLNLISSFVMKSAVQSFAEELPRMAELSFNGEITDDSILPSLTIPPELTLLDIYTLSTFTYQGLHDFGVKLISLGRTGVRVNIRAQAYESKLQQDEYEALQHLFADELKGGIWIQYFMVPNPAPDGLHDRVANLII
ncbi:hypothetical protein F4677DRAFT_413130 [Hypoxylon crocopeplum]|nr:hypothetical protein F4677DRAFT_413130 [Hypoxylon crocopeplum]